MTSPMCQFYEATGPDAAPMINSLRAGCVNRGAIGAKVVDSCPTDGNLGGCKTPVKVTGGANVQLDTTNFYYATAADASAFPSPATPAAVQQRCKSEMGAFVPAP
jgi:hypothetical protein